MVASVGCQDKVKKFLDINKDICDPTNLHNTENGF